MSQIIGKKVPHLSLPATGGKSINLKDFKGQTLILYFYPKDATRAARKKAGIFAISIKR